MSKIITREINNKRKPNILYLTNPPITGIVRPITVYNININKRLNNSTFKFVIWIFLLTKRNKINIKNKRFSNEAKVSNNEPLKKLKGLKKTLEIALKMDLIKLVVDLPIIGNR